MAECRTNAENIKIEPCYATWEEQNMVKLTAKPNTADSLDGKYFKISNLTTKFYVLMDSAAAVDPAPAGYTKIAVTLDPTASAVEVAEAVVEALNAQGTFNAAVDGCDPTSFYVQTKLSGAPLEAAADGTAGAATTFVVETVRDGAVFEAGFTDGDIELALTESVVDVTAHQTGAQNIAGLRNGRNIEAIALTLKETDPEKLRTIIKASGKEFTPSGVGATPVTGWGSEDTKSFANILADSRKLVLHPISKPKNDLSEDLCFLRAYPALESLVISGENPRMANLSFRVLPDQLMQKDIRQFVFGDHSQNLMAAGVEA